MPTWLAGGLWIIPTILIIGMLIFTFQAIKYDRKFYVYVIILLAAAILSTYSMYWFR